MRRIQALLLCVVLLMGGCKTLRGFGEVVAATAVVAGAAFLNYHYGHHHGHYHGHRGHHYCD